MPSTSFQTQRKIRVLVTGASGFVGRRLCQVLRDQDHFVRAVVRTTAPALAANEQFKIAQLGEATPWHGALDGIDVVIHLAARVHILNETDPDAASEYYRINVLASEHLMRSVAKAGVARFIYMSSVKAAGESSAVGADGQPIPLRERDPTDPEDDYGRTKRQAEVSLAALAKDLSVELVVIRPPLIYGPGVKANFQKLIRGVRQHFPFPLGAVRNQRSLVYLDNLVDATCLCALHPAAAGKTFFVTDLKPVSTADLVRLVAKSMQQRAIVVPVPIWMLRSLGACTGKSGAIKRLTESLVVSSDSIQQALGWSPPYSTEAGITATVSSFQTDPG